jgi:prophage maintenance system killer protein
MKSPETTERTEALVPHLEITMRMRWAAPSGFISSLLQRCESVSHSDFMEKETKIRSIENRCGKKALEKVLILAEQKENITFEKMQSVQQLILPKEQTVAFRIYPAYCDVRNERYFHFDGLEKMFSIKIRKDDVDEVHPLLKAVRLYLDIIFFHPFNDGNARAALLWMIFHCKRSGFSLPDFGTIFSFPFIPGDEKNYWQFSSMILQQIIRNGKP